ncbi:MAG: hypothetical protein ACFE7I_10180, partial [Candidatus Hodarchaeota archaeon]
YFIARNGWGKNLSDEKVEIDRLKEELESIRSQIEYLKERAARGEVSTLDFVGEKKRLETILLRLIRKLDEFEGEAPATPPAPPLFGKVMGVLSVDETCYKQILNDDKGPSAGLLLLVLGSLFLGITTSLSTLPLISQIDSTIRGIIGFVGPLILGLVFAKVVGGAKGISLSKSISLIGYASSPLLFLIIWIAFRFPLAPYEGEFTVMVASVATALIPLIWTVLTELKALGVMTKASV